MSSFSIFDLVLVVRKRMASIIAIVILIEVLALVFVQTTQTYTARMNLQYRNPEATEGQAPDGGALSVYDIMNPVVISSALRNLDIPVDLTVEDVRNRLSVTEVIDTNTQELQRASMELGEAYEVYPTEYAITYTYPGIYGDEFGNRVLYSLVKAYDDYFADQYYRKSEVTDFLKVVDYDNIEYMELCEVINTNLQEIIIKFWALDEKDSAFRSLTTGYSFSALAQLYEELHSVIYGKYYANVRAGLLSRNQELLTKSYQSKIDEITFTAIESKNNAEMYQKLMVEFYDTYKENSLYQQALQTQGTARSTNSNDNSLVFDYDLSLVINTYDDIVLSYNNTGASATNLTRQIEFYEKLIGEFENDKVPAGTKSTLLNENALLINDLVKRTGDYALLANVTIADYCDALTAKSLAYLVTVSVTPDLSLPLFLALGLAIGLAVAFIWVLFTDMFSNWLADKSKLISGIKPIALTESALLDMSPEEQAVYAQYKNGFDEFYLAYQPVVDDSGAWCQSEAFTRWNSKALGEVPPSVFLRSFARLGLLDELGLWTLQQACREREVWERHGKPEHVVSLNYSIQQLASPAFADNLMSVLTSTRADTQQHICFEISGGVMEDFEKAKRMLKMLKNMGARICIDRFGDSIDTFHVLDDLTIDMLKLSRQHIVDPEGGAIDPFLLQAIGYCRARGISTCMLGVETAEQRDMLLKLGVDYLQGYFYAKPAPLQQHITEMDLDDSGQEASK